ncbi:hypothetical protein [Flavobacterium sp. GP15]|uniref:hypothetical protein n=1 Tax=Flavobacterium sp. GP15 TaxID=2758567 RepID=UPI00165D9489|nr:hypothetical protein [Flavobacterium sp. GP15]
MSNSNTIVKTINIPYRFIIGFFCCVIVCSCNNNVKNAEFQESKQTNQDSLNTIQQERANFISDSIKASMNNTWTIYYSSLGNIGSIQNIEATDDNGCAFTTIADIEINDGMQISKKRVFKLYKVDSLGSLEWVKKISDWDFPTLTVTKQHNYFIATEKKLQLYDKSGTLKIEKDISSSKILDNLNNAYCFNENEITLVGKREERGIIIKLDMQLNIITSQIFGNEPERKYYSDGSSEVIGSPEYSQINSMSKSSNGTFYFTGKKKGSLWIGQVDNNLKPIWEKNDYHFEQNGSSPIEGNKILCEGANNVFVSSKYRGNNFSSLLMCVNSNGNVLWHKTYKGQIGDNDVSLMKFNNSLFLITFDSDGKYYSSDNPLYSKLHNVNFQGELLNESNINVNGNNILAFKIVSNTKNSFFVLARNDSKGKNKNKEFSGKSLISKFNSNGKIGENIYDFSEEKAKELSIDLDFNNNQQLADFLKIYDFRCSIGNGYSTVLSFSQNNNDVNSGKIQFTMFRIKGMGFDIVSERSYRYTIDKTKSQSKIYFNTNMQGEIYLENDGTLIMNDISRNERYVYRYSKK